MQIAVAHHQQGRLEEAADIYRQILSVQPKSFDALHLLGVIAPPFALERRRELDPERLHYESTKPGPAGGGSLILTPLERLEHLAALVPPRASTGTVTTV